MILATYHLGHEIMDGLFWIVLLICFCACWAWGRWLDACERDDDESGD